MCPAPGHSLVVVTIKLMSVVMFVGKKEVFVFLLAGVVI
jgi:hypothetical protein